MAAADAIGGLAAAAAMNEQMRSLNDRINIAMEQMPKQIRWQSELMLSQVPELMRAERDSILAAFDPRMQRTFEFVSGERAAMAAEFLVHREAMLAAIRGEREAMLSALREERAIVLAALKSERAIVLDSLGTVLPRAMREVIADTEPVVDRSADRLLLRIAALAAIPLIAGFILAIWALLIARRAASH